MYTGLTSAEVAVLTAAGWQIETEMLRLVARMLGEYATVIRRVVPASVVAAEFDEMSTVCAGAAEDRIDTVERAQLRLVT